MSQKILFLDRDGVVNVEIGEYVYQVERFMFVPGLFQFLRKAAMKGYKAIIVTNQGGISKGLYNHSDVQVLNRLMKEAFEGNEIPLLEIYYSPYHPNQTESLSRKPDSLLFEKALARFHAAPSECVMVGDRQRDMDAAAKAGIRGILVESNTDLYKTRIHDQL